MRLPRARNGTGRAREVLKGTSGWTVAALAGVAAAVAAGTLPDVIKSWLGEQRPFLTVLCVVAAGVFAGINLWQQRSRGVGIVVALPREEWREPWNAQWTVAAADHARRGHDSCFTVRRAVPSSGSGAERNATREDALGVAYELMSARLTELSAADPSTPVSLYVNAALPDAFELGAKFKSHVQRELRGMHDIPERVTLPQRSERPHTDFFPAVRISGRLKDPLSTAEAVRAAKLAEVVEEPHFESDPEGRAVAVVVHLSDNPLMVAQALRAAGAGCADARGEWARCRAALVIDGGPANLPETTADFELVVRHVYASWRAWNRARPQYADLTHRLFIAAPASVAFALGWLFGHTMRVVEHPHETGETCTSS
ncbi:hypothetical protein [Streptosporangium saharense]|uniref:SAVED domain-containing protein n=1 Tax=Streptosporangium saharense TaxID=1706840 RepID=A0A7W7QI66_9ACTN|nr:hypothetical protein [Streptosporangium saharense]MBB4913989.1 hypothetical protein [Streptosporangium saharense]